LLPDYVFIGAPLGAIIRKGGLGMPVVISVVFFLMFWVLSITGEKLSKDGILPPEIGMWMGCICFLPLGIWLTKKQRKIPPCSIVTVYSLKFYAFLHGEEEWKENY